MSARKPLDPGCDGSVFCPVDGHAQAKRGLHGWRLSHSPLTVGQRKTLREGEAWRSADGASPAGATSTAPAEPPGPATAR